MKNIFIIFLIFISFSCLTDKLDTEKYVTTDLIDNLNPPIMEFEEEIHNFDTVALGAEVPYSFKFENTGSSFLLIHSVKAACGCTVLKDWPKEPIPPGGTGEIPIILTTKRKGYTKKYISVLSNTKIGVQKLYLEGYVAGL